MDVNGCPYVIVTNWANNYTHVDIYKMTDELEMQKITPTWSTSAIPENEKFKIDFTDNVWVRGNRIYFMNSRNTSEVAYRYYDVASGDYSKLPVWIEYDKITAD